MAKKHILQIKYHCGSVEDQFFVSYFENSFGIGTHHCPFYSRDMEDCEENIDCGNFGVVKTMHYFESLARKLKATDLTAEECKKNLGGMLAA